MLTQVEIRFLESVPRILREILDELQTLNKKLDKLAEKDEDKEEETA